MHSYLLFVLFMLLSSRYAKTTQVGSGIHLRLRSRAFVFQDEDTSKTVGFVSIDAGMASDIIKMKVVTKLATLLPGVFNDDNLCISGTHTHSGPGGFLQYVVYQISTYGWFVDTVNTMVDGIAASVVNGKFNSSIAFF